VKDGFHSAHARLLAASGVQWSVRVADLSAGEELYAVAPDTVCATASVGKLFLLVEAARQIVSGELDPYRLLQRTDADWVEDSGLWHLLQADRLSVNDIATLIGAVSDNLATNVLLSQVGLDAVQRTTDQIGLSRTRLNDRVRRPRTKHDPSALSQGCAAELSGFMADLWRGDVVSKPVSDRVLDWLKAGADLSMVAQPFGLDPLAHFEVDRGLRLWHKTGTNDDSRADVGVVTGPTGSVAYAVLAQWDSSGEDRRMPVMETMQAVGRAIRTLVEQP